MRVHILDPQLNLVEGHYGRYDAAIAAELTRRGIETSLYGTARSSTVTSQIQNVEPVFLRGMFDEVGKDHLVWAIENFVQLGREFHAQGGESSGRFARIFQFGDSHGRNLCALMAEEFARRQTARVEPDYQNVFILQLEHGRDVTGSSKC